MLLIIVDSADNNALGPITGLIRTEFGLTATEVGLYAGIGALFGLLFLIPTGELIKRVGFRAAGTITPLTVVTGAMISLMAPTFAILVLGRATITAGVRGSTVTGQAGGTSVAPPAIMGTLWALINSSLVIGGIIGSVWLGGFVGAVYGWRAVFALEAIVTLGIAVLIALFLRMPTRPDPVSEQAAPNPMAATQVPFNAYKSVPIWLLGLGTGLAATGTSLTLAFGAVIATDQWGLGPQFVGDAFGLGYLISLPLMFVLAASVDRTGRRKMALATATLVGLAGALVAIGAVGVSTPDGAESFRIAIILFVSCSVAAIALFFAAAPLFVPPGASLGPVYGLMTTLALAWAVVLPIVAGAIRDSTGSFSGVFVLVAVCELLAMVLAWLLPIRPAASASASAA
jgi:MFS family permease